MRFLACPALGGAALPGISSLSVTNDIEEGISNACLYNGILPTNAKSLDRMPYGSIKLTCYPQKQCNKNSV